MKECDVAGTFSVSEDDEKCRQSFRKPEERGSLGRPRRRVKVNINLLKTKHICFI
jgi:hypothetical protein